MDLFSYIYGLLLTMSKIVVAEYSKDISIEPVLEGVTRSTASTQITDLKVNVAVR